MLSQSGTFPVRRKDRSQVFEPFARCLHLENTFTYVTFFLAQPFRAQRAGIGASRQSLRHSETQTSTFHSAVPIYLQAKQSFKWLLEGERILHEDAEVAGHE